MKTYTHIQHIQFQLWGWILFIVSALFFIGSSIRAGDIMSLMGGLFFLVSCIVFMVPLLRTAKPAADTKV
jgi:F0F1-type ATP synthase assembly protein I